MENNNRRDFVKNVAIITAGSSLLSFDTIKSTKMDAFVHHVFFWLKNPGNNEDLQALLEGLKKLSKIDYIKMFHIGKPADTNRDVIDRSYAVSWMLVFNNKAEEERYQKDPIHLNFVDTCKHLWERVVVYDSVNA